MAKGGSVQGYLTEQEREKFNYIKASYEERDPGINWSDSAVLKKMIDDTHHKILGGQTNQARITSIVERLDKLEETISGLVQAIQRLEGDGK